MIKRIAVAAGIAALLGTSAAAFAGSSITLSSTQLEQPKPVAVDGQWRMTDYLGGGVVAGTTATAATVATTSSTVDSSVDIGTAIRVSVDDVSSAVSEDDPRWDCHTMGNRICGQE